MPKIDKWIIDKVKDAADIVDVVSDFITLHKVGVNYTGLCPFHDDHNEGNFIVRPKGLKNGGNSFHCFQCMRRGEGGGPVDFLMKHENMSFADAIRWLGKKYSIEVDDVPVNFTPPPPRPVPPPPPTLAIPREAVTETMKYGKPDKNLFVYWLYQQPWTEQQHRRLADTLWHYCVGGWHDGRVVFWEIDHDGVPRAAKLMRYQPDGHRDKTQHPGWIYNQDGWRQTLKPEDHTVEKPLFGAHLLKRYPKATVNVVESEKTALIMATFYGCMESQLWLACGGLQHLNLEAMQPLIDQGRTVWLWPDKDGVEAWQEMAEKLGSDKVRVYTRFFDTCWRDHDGPKADAADIILRMMRNGDQPDEPESATGNHSGADQATGMVEWNTDEPFLDPEEIVNPMVHQWRETLRLRYNFRKPKPLPEGVKTVGETMVSEESIRKLIGAT